MKPIHLVFLVLLVLGFVWLASQQQMMRTELECLRELADYSARAHAANGPSIRDIASAVGKEPVTLAPTP